MFAPVILVLLLCACLLTKTVPDPSEWNILFLVNFHSNHIHFSCVLQSSALCAEQILCLLHWKLHVIEIEHIYLRLFQICSQKCTGKQETCKPKWSFSQWENWVMKTSHTNDNKLFGLWEEYSAAQISAVQLLHKTDKDVKHSLLYPIYQDYFSFS